MSTDVTHGWNCTKDTCLTLTVQLASFQMAKSEIQRVKCKHCAVLCKDGAHRTLRHAMYSAGYKSIYCVMYRL